MYDKLQFRLPFFRLSPKILLQKLRQFALSLIAHDQVLLYSICLCSQALNTLHSLTQTLSDCLIHLIFQATHQSVLPECEMPKQTLNRRSDQSSNPESQRIIYYSCWIQSVFIVAFLCFCVLAQLFCCCSQNGLKLQNNHTKEQSIGMKISGRQDDGVSEDESQLEFGRIENDLAKSRFQIPLQKLVTVQIVYRISNIIVFILMGKFLLILLLCLTYHATASIIFVPVSFSQASTEAAQPSEDATASSTTVSSEPVSSTTSQLTETSLSSNLAPNDQPSTESVTTTYQPTNTVINDSTNIQQESSTGTEPASAEVTIKVESNPEQSGSQEQSSEPKGRENNFKNQNSNRKIPPVKINNSGRSQNIPFVQINTPGRYRRQDCIGFERSIVLMKQFPQKNAVLSNSNINFVQKKITLQKEGPFKLTFSAYVVPSHTTQPINIITLVLDLDGSLTKLPLTAGQETHTVTLRGQKGVNSLIFSLQGESKGLGLVSVVLNQFKMQ